jgi:hypothetical protein
VWTFDLPVFAFFIAVKDKRAFARSDQDPDLAHNAPFTALTVFVLCYTAIEFMLQA